MHGWTFLTNHALVLNVLAKYPRITGRELAAEVGVTERATRKIIADLETEGYITNREEGRKTHKVPYQSRSTYAPRDVSGHCHR